MEGIKMNWALILLPILTGKRSLHKHDFMWLSKTASYMFYDTGWYTLIQALYVVINTWCTCTARLTVVGSVCACLLIKSHPTSGASVFPENTVTYILSGQQRQNLWVFL